MGYPLYVVAGVDRDGKALRTSRVGEQNAVVEVSTANATLRLLVDSDGAWSLHRIPLRNSEAQALDIGEWDMLGCSADTERR